MTRSCYEKINKWQVVTDNLSLLIALTNSFSGWSHLEQTPGEEKAEL